MTRRAIVLAVVGTAAYAALLAATDPFTPAADVATAVPLAVGVVLAIRAVRRGAPREHFDWRAAAPWLGLLTAVVVWELVMYASGARSAHPTLSSIEDVVTRARVLKAGVAFCWLVVGWALVR
jgi:hypothetical protein